MLNDRRGSGSFLRYFRVDANFEHLEVGGDLDGGGAGFKARQSLPD